MKGVILAGGTGSRLYPSTKVVNKHLLPVYDQPMIYYPIDTLKKSGIQEILIVSRDGNISDFMHLLGSGRDLGVDFTYRVQDGAGGIADALSLAEDFSGGEPLAVILGDNIFQGDFSEDVLRFNGGAHIFGKRVESPERFGIIETSEDGRVRSLEEKPAFPKSDMAQTGFYIYDSQIFEVIENLEPSVRGEFEITDVNNHYLEINQLKMTEVKGYWVDAGTHDSLLEASTVVKKGINTEAMDLLSIESSMNSHGSASLKSRVTVGIITQNNQAQIIPTIQSLLKQDYKNIDIYVFDRGSTDNTVDLIEDNFSQVTVINGKFSDSYAFGHNVILEKSSSFYFALDPIVYLESNYLSELMEGLLQNADCGAVGGKMKQWDFSDFLEQGGKSIDLGKTNFISSIGIKVFKTHRFTSLGEREVDYGQYNKNQEVFGISKGAILFRKKALEDIAYAPSSSTSHQEFFDEMIEEIKADVDLSYRFQWSGWSSWYIYEAVCYHSRFLSKPTHKFSHVVQNRKERESGEKEKSFFSHQIILQKNFSNGFSSEVKQSTHLYNLKVMLYLLFFEPQTLHQWYKVMKHKKTIASRRKNTIKEGSQERIEKFMYQE